MRTLTILVALCAIHLSGLCGQKQLPRDIELFAAQAEACEHLGGEYDGDLSSSRKRQIERDVRKYCGGAAKQLPKLRAKYKHNPAMLQVIDRHVNTAVKDYR